MIEFSMAFFSKIERNEKEKSVEFIEKNFLSKFSLMSFAAIATVRGGDYGRGFRTESSNKYVVLLAFEVLADSLDILPQKGNYSDKNGEREGRYCGCSCRCFCRSGCGGLCRRCRGGFCCSCRGRVC